MHGRQPLIVVGAGLGGLSAAMTAAALGLEVVVVEKGDRKVGGTAAYSGGQVWIGANHVEARLGKPDSVEETLAYVHGRRHATPERSMRDGARVGRERPAAARWFEDAAGRVLADHPRLQRLLPPRARGLARRRPVHHGAPFDGRRLGADRERLHVSPTFTIGLTYAEIFAWGGMTSRTTWDADVLAAREPRTP